MQYTPEWLKNIIVSFDEKINTFYKNYNALILIQSSVPSSLYGEYKTLIDRASVINQKINSSKKFVVDAKEWLSSAMPMLNGVGLGALPIIPLAIVTAAVGGVTLISIISYWLTDAFKFSTKINAVQKAGGSVQDILNVKSDSISSPGIMETSESIVKWLVIGGVVIAAIKLLNVKD